MLSARQRPSLKQERAERRQRKKAKREEQELFEKVKKAQAAKKLDPKPSTRSVYSPSFSVMFRILTLIRVVGALTSPLQDCDEVYNYWEPLHFLSFGYGKQTWEYAEQFALRSYGFLFVYKGAISVLHFVLGFGSKVQVFYGLRILMAVMAAACEAGFARAVAVYVDRRMGNYTVLALFGMAGMYHSAVALLPTTFAMYWGMVGSAAAMVPLVDGQQRWVLWRRTVVATAAFVVMAVAGWPYAGILAVPYLLEEVVEGGQGRVKRVAVAVATGVSAVVVVGGALAMVDSRYYGHLVAAGWNQVKYNVVSGHSDLYGTEPWYFYIKNGLINGNIIMVLALLSLPAWITYYVVLRLTTSTGTAGPTVDRLFASHRLLLYRILPFFVSLGIFSLQPHKEERFLAIAYPHMCFNAAVCLSLLHPLRAWMQAKTKQRWGAQSDLFNMGILAVAAAIGLLRMGALHQYYGGVASVFLLLPKLTASGSAAGNMLLPIGMTIKTLWGDRKVLKEEAMGGDAQKVVCMGKDWYRFPSSYWLPAGYRLEFIESQFTGHLPGSFVPVSQSNSQSVVDSTRARRADFNDLNRWEPSHVVSESQCDYVVDTEFPSAAGGEEVPFARREKEWRKRGCERILDAQGSGALGRVLYLPPQVNGRWQRWGEICVFERLE